MIFQENKFMVLNSTWAIQKCVPTEGHVILWIKRAQKKLSFSVWSPLLCDFKLLQGSLSVLCCRHSTLKMGQTTARGTDRAVLYAPRSLQSHGTTMRPEIQKALGRPSLLPIWVLLLLLRGVSQPNGPAEQTSFSCSSFFSHNWHLELDVCLHPSKSKSKALSKVNDFFFIRKTLKA